MAIPVVALIGLLALFLGTGVWVAMALLGVGSSLLMMFRSMPVERLLGQVVYNSTTGAELIALPLFILMAEILFRTRMSEMLFSGLAPWTTRLPGRLIHANVLGCTLFAAVSGSSAATTATVGRITASELLKRGYDRNLVIGSLAGAGTLGFLIPPSTMLIIYGVLSQTSIIKLFIAGIIPGLLCAALYMIYIAVASMLRPATVPAAEPAMPWSQRLRALVDLLPVLSLILAVVGSMYAGIASPSEAAAVGVAGSLAIALLQRTMTLRGLLDALIGAACTISMISLIIAGAVFLSVALGFLGIPRMAVEWLTQFELSPLALIVLLLAFYVVLGCVLEGLSIMVMTLPVTLPLVVAAGFDPIWFGVFMILVIELAQITPPVGFNLVVIQSLTGMKIGEIAWATFPFFLIMVFFTLFLAVFPGIVTFLPNSMG
ncbi:TRAP transporter large permease [Telmatospirillum sp. J64-1]|uniref:TRAP transporter large permease n=1 Tax=Telmatospirillum sp. J64-1 TaxID=2502183 RepID=UPI00115D24C0|nr:TRAP transporter large permease subunit [Telmatospirillum sp. J64-1]